MISCGACKSKHASVELVRMCSEEYYAEKWEAEAEMAAEAAAEYAFARSLEIRAERGGWFGYDDYGYGD